MSVQTVLQSYADRGIFSGFSRRPARGDREEYRFAWLADDPFTLVHDPARRTLVFRDLLPAIPARSPMDRDLRRWLVGRASANLPAHRRIDPDLARVRAVNRKGRVSVEFEVRGDPEEAARRAIGLANEIFHGFLAGRYHDYMVENFNAPAE